MNVICDLDDETFWWRRRKCYLEESSVVHNVFRSVYSDVTSQCYRHIITLSSPCNIFFFRMNFSFGLFFFRCIQRLSSPLIFFSISMIIISTNTSIVRVIQSEIYGNTYFSIVQKGDIFVDVFVRYHIHVLNLMNLSDILNSKDTSALSKPVMIIF